jgi:hypothetical protein
MGAVFAKLSNYSLFLRPDQFYRYCKRIKNGFADSPQRPERLFSYRWVLKPDFVKEILGQTNEQQRHFNE